MKRISSDLSESARGEGETGWGGCTIKENDEFGGGGGCFRSGSCGDPSGPKLKVMEM